MAELLQDSIGERECRRLALWFASRMDSMWLVRRWAYERMQEGQH
jgi:hypothetical protein